MYNWSVIHGIKRKPHLSLVWNWYHFVAIAILHQPRPTDSADINTVGGIVQPATFVELRFCEFAPESRAFWGVKKCENGAVRFEVIWVYFINALINLITPYIVWKTKTRQFICISFHLSKVDGPFIGLVGTAESRTFLGGQHTSKEFSHKKTSFCDYWDFFICCWQHFGLYAQKVLSYP